MSYTGITLLVNVACFSPDAAGRYAHTALAEINAGCMYTSECDSKNDDYQATPLSSAVGTEGLDHELSLTMVV